MNSGPVAQVVRARPAQRARTDGSSSGCKGGRRDRTRAMDDHRARRLAKAFRQRHCSRAKTALGQGPADEPVGPATAGAVIDLILAIDRMVAASRGIKPIGNFTQHGRSSNKGRTCDESLGFFDKPNVMTCHRATTVLSRAGTIKCPADVYDRFTFCAQIHRRGRSTGKACDGVKSAFLHASRRRGADRSASRRYRAGAPMAS